MSRSPQRHPALLTRAAPSPLLPTPLLELGLGGQWGGKPEGTWLLGGLFLGSLHRASAAPGGEGAPKGFGEQDLGSRVGCQAPESPLGSGWRGLKSWGGWERRGPAQGPLSHHQQPPRQRQAPAWLLRLEVVGGQGRSLPRSFPLCGILESHWLLPVIS